MSNKHLRIMNILPKILIGSLLFIFLLTACIKETPPITTSEIPTTEMETETGTETETETETLARNFDQQLVEAQGVFALMLSNALVETARAPIIAATNMQQTCPMISVAQQGMNCGDDDLITIDFGTDCVLSGGSTMSGVLNIRSFAPCEMIGAIEIPSLIAASEPEKMILTFTSITFNGYTIEYQQGQFSNGIFFWNGGNTTNPYFVFTFGLGDEFKVTHPNGIDYSQFMPFTSVSALEIRPSDPMVSLDIAELDAAEYSIKLLAQLDNQNQLINYWRVQTFENGNTNPVNDNFIITENGEDLIMTPQCNAIKDGTLQLRSILSSPSNALVVSEYEYGYQESDAANLVECDPNNPKPADACEDYVWACHYDVNGACDVCRLIKCFFTN